MDQTQVAPPKRMSTFVMLLILVAVGVAIYAVYNFVFSGNYNTAGTLVPLISGQVNATTTPTIESSKVPIPYEGGDYSVSFWMYISSFNVNRNMRKHVFQIGGKSFQTLLIGLGAYKNTLLVRTHSKDPGDTTEGFQTTAPKGTNPMTTPPTAMDMTRGDGTLTSTDLDSIFASHPADDSLLESPVVCDAPEVDLQRWVHVAVVLSGRMIDVYIDGKLERSCLTKSYYKVDPTGVTVTALGRGGFDGYLSNLSVGNYALNPGEIYGAYSNGPSGKGPSVLSSLFGFLKGGIN